MAIFYDWYENPRPQNKQDEPVTLHPRIHYNGSTSTATLRRYIQNSCSLTEGDVDAVLAALSHYVSNEMSEGHTVHLNGIGYLTPVLGCSETVTPQTKRKSTKVKLKSIKFRPDKLFKRRMGAVNITCLKQHDPLHLSLTDEQIEAKIRTYLQSHDFLTRAALQVLCHLSRTTASRHIKRLCDAGILKNRGLRNQPIYCLVGE